MECRVSELRYKEIINVSDGSRYGWGGGGGGGSGG